MFLILTGCGQAFPALFGDGAPPNAETDSIAPHTTPSLSQTSAQPNRLPNTTPAPGSAIDEITPTPVPAIAVLPESLRGRVVRFWHPYSGEAQILLDLMIQEFNKTNPWGIRVESQAVSGFSALTTSLRQAFEAGAMPEVWTALNYQALQLDADGKVVADLTPYIGDAIYGLSPEEQGDFLPSVWNQERIPAPALKGRASQQGKHLGLPWARNGDLLFYNRTWAQELGFATPPETPTGFRDQACAAARFVASHSARLTEGVGGWMILGTPSELIGWLYAFGAEIARPDGRGYQFDTPEARQAMDFLAQLASQKCLWQASQPEPLQAMMERQAMFAVVSLSDLANLRPASAAEEKADLWQWIPFPSPLNQPVVVAYGYSLYLTQSTPEQELAGWLFMRWLTSPENQARWAQFNFLYPSRQSATEKLRRQTLPNPDWAMALSYQSLLRPEPYYVSWQRVRWSLNDALSQLIASQGQPVQAVEILRMLDELAAEIHLQIR